MCENDAEVASIGSYVVVQRQNYYKLYKVTENGNLMLGKDQLEMSGIVGKPYWTTFKMEPKKAGKRLFLLKETKNIESLAQDLRNTLPSGSDNRAIVDDGTSQKLSTEEIVGLRESGKSSKEIVGQLIENSKTFQNKTEYSQEKYLKKKEKKYFEYITIRKPTVKLLQEIYFRLDHQKINGLRMDTLAQICSYCDVKASGLYILYDSGSQGLSAAALLSRIGFKTTGQLLHLHPGNIPQKTLVHAMNFPDEQLTRMLTVNIYSLLRMFYQSDEKFLDELREKQEKNRDLKSSSDSVENLCSVPEKSERLEVTESKEEATKTKQDEDKADGSETLSAIDSRIKKLERKEEATETKQDEDKADGSETLPAIDSRIKKLGRKEEATEMKQDEDKADGSEILPAIDSRIKKLGRKEEATEMKQDEDKADGSEILPAIDSRIKKLGRKEEATEMKQDEDKADGSEILPAIDSRIKKLGRKEEATETKQDEDKADGSEILQVIDSRIKKLGKEDSSNLKRKSEDTVVFGEPKKPRWLIETQEAVEILKERKAEGLAILAREHPLNIVRGLFPFLGASRPFVIYHALREPLLETYVALKQRCDVINLRLFSNFLRSYQVLPDRTHPDILMSDTGGYLLCGYFVN